MHYFLGNFVAKSTFSNVQPGRKMSDCVGNCRKMSENVEVAGGGTLFFRKQVFAPFCLVQKTLCPTPLFFLKKTPRFLIFVQSQ